MESNKPSKIILQNLLEEYKNSNYELAEKLALSIIEEFPNHQFAWTVVGAVYKQIGKLEESILANKNAVKIAPNDPSAHNNLGITLRDSGRLKEAEESLRMAINLKPNYAEAYNNLGITIKDQEECVKYFRKAIVINPKYAGAYNNLGITLRNLGRLKEAEYNTKKAIELNPNFVEACNNLGLILTDLEKFEEAEIFLQKAIYLKDDFAEAYNNLGIVLNESLKLAEAEKKFKKAIVLKSNFTEAKNNLGNLLKDIGKNDEAEKNFREVIALRPYFAEAYNNLGLLLKEKDQIEESIFMYCEAIKLKPNFTESLNNLGNALEGVIFKHQNKKLQKIIRDILEKKTFVRPQNILTAVISLLKLEKVLIYAFEKKTKDELSYNIEETIFELTKLPLLLDVMAICPITDIDLEVLLTDIRSILLSSILNSNKINNLLKFQSALALQCFTNEYIYNFGDHDVQNINKLEKKIIKILSNGQQPHPNLILCLASYYPLHKFKWINSLNVNLHIKKVFERQVIEVKEQNFIKNKIKILTEVKNNISSKVRVQYENSPYPRWVNIGLPYKSSTISRVIFDLKLNLFNNEIKNIESPNILIAGCGTGQHSIETATRFKNSNVLAIDLSLSSLSYAKYKTRELGINNIEYMQADILNLSNLGQKFDIIESIGVLHHMENPIEGWKVLKNCLADGGLMRVGLYSELARQSIVKIRNEILNLKIKFGNKELIKFRNDLMFSKKQHHKDIHQFFDFYSLSEFRDLLFHVQESRFTINKINEIISKLGLHFCGFESSKIVKKFMLADNNLNDINQLNKWISFEENNQNAFAAMYQFWCQKIN